MNSEVKKKQIDDFVSYTCTSRQIAQRFLVNAKWNMQQAMNSFYDQGAPMPQPQIPTQIAEVQKFLNSNYVTEGQKQKIINQEGLEKLFTEILKVDTSNIVIGHIMINVMEMKKAGEATKQNIYNLLKYTNSKSFLEVSKNIGKLEKQIKQRQDLFKNMYMNFFEFYSVTKVPTLDFQVAVQIWETYLKGIMLHHQYFVEYLKTLEKKIIKVHRDLWKMVYQFAVAFKSVSQYSENEGWPIMIDDFVTFLRAKNIK